MRADYALRSRRILLQRKLLIPDGGDRDKGRVCLVLGKRTELNHDTGPRCRKQKGTQSREL